MEWEQFNTANWQRGESILLVDGIHGTVLRRGEGAYYDLLHVQVEGEHKPAPISYRDIVCKL